MGELNDRALARQTLELRKHGYSLQSLLRLRAMRVLFIIVCAIVLLLLMYPHWMFYVGVGMICGAVAREIGSLRAGQKRWRFYDKVTDWEKVAKIANESN